MSAEVSQLEFPGGQPGELINIAQRREKRLVQIKLLSFLFAAALTGFASAKLFDTARIAAPPVSLRFFRGSVAADGHHVSVSATVRNDRDEPQVARVWWLLSEPGASPPWEHQAYQSAVQEITLAPGERRVLRWDEDALIPSGSYELSAWVHRRNDAGDFVHSDGRVQDSPYLEIRNASDN